MPKVTVSEEYSQEDVDRALNMLEKQREYSRKYAEDLKNNPEKAARLRNKDRRRNAANAIVLAKARQQGIEATEDEINAYMASKYPEA